MNQNQKKILITGTHLTPALELIRQLQSDPKVNWQIEYIGRRSNSNDPHNSSIESQIIPSLGINFYPIYCGKLDRRFLPNTIIGIPKTIMGFMQSLILINKLKPDIVISFGGYVSVPVIISSWINQIISVTHEQTLTNSLTTKINSHFVKKIALSFNNPNQINQLPQKKIVVTGNLLRYQLFQKIFSIPQNIKNKLKLINNLPTIYITAGNQGSHFINIIVRQIISSLKDFNLIHQTGKNDFLVYKKLENKYSNYFVSDYFNTQDFSWIIQNSDIIISRSGANTSQEIVAFNKKSILIPLPKSQQNEQYLNAQWVKSNLPTKTEIISENKLNSKLLISTIKKLSTIKTDINQQKQKPNLKLLNLIYELI